MKGEKNKVYEYDKWDAILPLIFIIGLVIGLVIIGILVIVMTQSYQIESTLQMNSSMTTTFFI